MPPRTDLLPRYLAHRRWLEPALWCAMFALQILANSITVTLEIRRLGLPFRPWEVVTWEASSNLSWLALVPLIAWLLRRWPLHIGVLRANLPRHLAASLGVSVLHVLVMVAARQGVYAAFGERYEFGHWPTELAYEALKDVRSYAMVVGIMLGYRLLLWRWQGEASVLQAPDDAVPTAAVACTTVGATVNPAVAAAAPTAPPPSPADAEPADRFLVRKLGKEFLLPVAEIEWVQACGNYVNLHRRQHDYPLRATLAAMERRLGPQGFVRVHRSFLVNLACVAVIEPTESGDARLRMADGATVPCSRTYLEPLRARLSR
jgi:hypothetical protein